MRLATILAVSAILAPVAGAAQRESVDSVHLRNDCRLAAQTISTGHPAPHLKWALGAIVACSPREYGAAIAAAVRRARSTSDTSVLVSYWGASRWLIDGELFGAAMEIAEDRSATEESRVFALLAVLRMQLDGRDAEYRNLVGGFYGEGPLVGVRGGCAQTTVIDDNPRVGSPLPADASVLVAALRQRLAADVSEPEDVRTAASCLPGPPRPRSR